MSESKEISVGLVGTSWWADAMYLPALADHPYGRITAIYGRKPEYVNRFDRGRSGAGSIADIGSHFLYLAYWFYGEITTICCQLGQMISRPPLDPAGNPYEQVDDTAIVMLTFKNGAQGVI